MLGDARRGVAWLELLKHPRPEPSADLLERILAQTSQLTEETEADFAGAYVPLVPAVPGRSNVIPFRPRMPFLPSFRKPWMEPRLAMTAAMAFFSIALTLNLTGVKLNELHASDLKPTSIRRNFFQANAQAVRYYDNLRVVHVMESRVDDLRQGIAGDDKPIEQHPAERPETPKPDPQDAPRKPEDGHGMSRQESPSARPEVLKTSEVKPSSSVAGGVA
jgi:hypothetical protein